MNKPTIGPIGAVPCPNCGQASDLRGFRDMGVLEEGATVTCDHCKRTSRVVGVGDRVVVTWGPSSGPMTSVRCPSCQKVEDLTPIHEMGLLERGNKVACDHCNATHPIVKVTPQTIVTLAAQR